MIFDSNKKSDVIAVEKRCHPIKLDVLDEPVVQGDYYVMLIISHEFSKGDIDLNRVLTRVRKLGKMGRHFPVREKSGILNSQGKSHKMLEK